MGRGSGLGVAIVGLFLILALGKQGKLTRSQIVTPGASYSYSQYQRWALASDEEVQADPESEFSTTYTGRRIRTVTVQGRPKIPLPGGGTAPMPTPHVGRVDVGKMLKPVTPTSKFKYMVYEEEDEAPEFKDVGGITSVNLRLKPI